MNIISKFFPESFKEYREPFLGGGSPLIYILQNYMPEKVLANDLYFELFQFWNHVKNDLDNLINKIVEFRAQYPIGKELYNFAKAQIVASNDNLEIAALFFLLNRITFSGISESGGYSQESFEKRFTLSSIHRVMEVAPLLNSVEIHYDDYKDILDIPGKDVFIFCDPPYRLAKGLYGRAGAMHHTFDHERFASDMKNCSHKWCITYDDSPETRALFSFASIEPWNVVYGMRNSGTTNKQQSTEIVIRNYV
jgi:DNA adenine methylase